MDLPTYDPTNAGNKPGDGPLRIGGRSASNVPGGGNDHLPSTVSPQAAAQAPAVQMARDLWGGTAAVRERTVAYLPKAPGESQSNYSDRLKRSVFFNAFRTTIEGLVGLVFRKDPVLGPDVPSLMAEHCEDINMEGTHLDVFLRDIEADAMTVGHAAIFVEYPDTGGGVGLTRLDERTLRPYWIPVRKEDILSWRTDLRGRRRVLTQVVLREVTSEPSGDFGSVAVTRYRVLNLDVRGRVTWRLLRVTKARTVVEEGSGMYPTQIEIPIAEVPTSGRRGLFDSDPPLQDLGFLNIAHYQQWSDYATCIHKTSVPIFFGRGLPVKKGPDGKPTSTITLGPNSAIIATDAHADAKYVSHDGAALGSCKAALDDLKADMATLGLAMLAPQKRVAETAEAQRLNKSTTDAPLSVAARALEDAAERCLGFHARYLGMTDGGGSIEINRDFEGLLLDAPVMRAYAELVKVGFPERQVLEALQRGGRIRRDANLDELEMLWAMGARTNEGLGNELPDGGG